MPNVVKYSTTAENNAIKKGNMAIGVNSVDYGDGSGWYNTIDVPTGGYVVYVNKASNGPSIMVPPDDTALVGAARSFGASSSVTTAAGALNYFASQSDMMVVNKNYNNIVTSGLVLNLDASFVASYPVSGTSWYDISGSGFTGTLTNGPTFNTGGWIVFDGLDDYVSVSSPQLLNPGSNSFTVESLIYQKDTGPNGVIEARGDNLHGFLWLLNYSVVGRVLFALNTTTDVGQNWYHPTVDTFGDVNRWMYLSTVVNRSNETIIFYKNGVKQGNTVSITSSGTIDPSGGYRYWIAADLGGDESNSNVSLTKQYNRTLSESEVLQNYYGGPIVTSGLTFAVDAGNLVSFQNGSGSTFSLVGSYTGVLQNGVSYTTGGGGSWVFDGSDDRILLDSSITMGNGSTGWTISAWVKTTTNVTGLGQGTIISNQSGGPVYSQLCINSGKICYWVYKTSWVQYLGNSTINTGNWVNLVWRNNVSNTMTFFVNGVSDGTVSDSSIGGPTTNPLDSIGRYTTSNSFAGDIALIMIHRAALTQNEIIQNFNAHRNRFGL